jgi:tetratricopeptide (TPR) repeat protein
MKPGGGNPRSRNRRRWALAIVLFLVVLAAGTSAARWMRLRGPGRDPLRLELLYQAWSEFDAKRYDAATATLDRRQSEVASTPLDWMLRARIAESRGRLAEALNALKHIPDSDAIGAKARLKEGQIERARGHASAAQAAYRRSLALDPALIQARRELAYFSALQLRYQECDAEFRALARRMPLDYVLAFAWCQNFCRIWDPYEARKALTRFVAGDPTDRWSRLALATSYRLSTEFDEADKVLLPLPDTDPDARVIRIRLALDRGEIEAAEELARHGPENHAGLNLLRGEFALHGADPQQAATYFRAVLESDPYDRDALYGLGLSLKKLGDPGARGYLDIAFGHDRLKRAIQDSVSTIRTDPQLFDHLGEMCESVNRPDEARTWYQLAISRDPLDTRAHQAVARLEKRISATSAESESGKSRAN